MVTSTNVPETDYTEWASGTTYALAARVRVTSTHKVYQSTQASNLNHTPTDPANIGVWWQEVSPTNRYKMYDTSTSTVTTNTTSIDFTVNPGTVTNGLGFIGLQNVNTARVIMVDPVDGTVFDTTYDLREIIPEANWHSYYFGLTSLISDFTITDLPSYGSATIRVILTGGTGVEVGLGTFIMGQQRSLGLGTEYGARISIQDYSRNEYNDYGDLILVKRNFSQRASFETTLTAAETDYVNRFITGLRSSPVLWIGTEDYESTIIFGIFKEFEIVFPYPQHNKCSLELYGVSRL